MERRIDYTLDGENRFSGRLTLAGGTRPECAPLMVLAHGAANTMDHPLLVALARGLTISGISCLRFNFPYSEAGRSTPDAQSLLEAAWREVLTRTTTAAQIAPRGIVAAGKSMGGRIASQMAAGGRLPADGLIFYGYPLHPPGRPQELRDAHLDRIPMPMLFFAGTRDPFCRIDLMRPVVDRLGGRATLVEIEGGDHSFALTKAEAPLQTGVYARILKESSAWLQHLHGTV